VSGPRKRACRYSARLAEKGDWLRGATRYGAKRHSAATVPVPFVRHLASSQRGTGTIAGDLVGGDTAVVATEPVPICDRRAARCGVTAVELVVVILILAIVAAAAVPRYVDNLMRVRVDAAARRIVADLAAAQAHAKATSSSQTVTFVVPPQGSRYEIVGMKDPDRPGEAYVVNLAASPYHVAFSSVNLGGVMTLVYNGYGVPGRSGTIVVQAGKFVRTVTIDSSTGMASFQ